jgi:hypothetical protein
VGSGAEIVGQLGRSEAQSVPLGREWICAGACRSLGSGWPPELCLGCFAHASAEDKPCLEVPVDLEVHPKPCRPPARGRGRGRDLERFDSSHWVN